MTPKPTRPWPFYAPSPGGLILSTAQNPIISVVVATRNRACLLLRAVDSAVRQGAEVVVVDDASIDDTNGAFTGVPGVEYVRLNARRGPCQARNVGVDRATGEFVLFLDDDDYLEPGALDVCRSLIEVHPAVDLFFHNCYYGDGKPPIPADTPATPYTYADWLDGRFEVELKPMVRRSVFQRYRFPDTGAGGEGIMWAKIIRDHGALVDGRPIIRYDTKSVGRLTSAASLLAHGEENSRIADEWLANFADDVRARNPRRWARRVLAAATYHVICGRRSRARELVRSLPQGVLSLSERAAFWTASLLPVPLARLLFIAHRRELIATIRTGRGWWRPLISA
jgi:glycosyltransferase involved in cell wall biosynthesis